MDGKVTTAIGNKDDSALSVAIQPDGKIVAAGYTNHDIALARYHTDGTLDNSFGTGGILTTDFDTGSEDFCFSVCIQSDGKIIAAGALNDGTNADMLVVRCLSGPSVGAIDAPATFNSPLIYPNPVFSRVLTLAYSLPSPSSVHIELLDLHGNIFATVLDAARFAGESKETLRLPEGLPNGFYLLNIRTERGGIALYELIS